MQIIEVPGKKYHLLAVFSLESPSSTTHMARHMGCEVYHDEDRHYWSRRVTKLTSFRAQGDRFWVRILQEHRIILCRLHRKPLTSLDQIWRALRRPFSRASRFLRNLALLPLFVCMSFSRSQNLEVIRINRRLLRWQHHDSKSFHVKNPLTGEVQSLNLRPMLKEGKNADEACSSGRISTLALFQVAKRCFSRMPPVGPAYSREADL